MLPHLEETLGKLTETARRSAGHGEDRLLLWLGARGPDPRAAGWPSGPLRTMHQTVHPAGPVRCNICGWRGDRFGGEAHSESAICPRCGSVARDRYIYHCWASRSPYRRGLRLLETSPRLTGNYRRWMSRIVDYTSSDFDQRAHKAAIRLDLTAIDLPDESFDVILTSHVLEHVADTARALAELRRVLAPDGVVYLMVPIPAAVTAAPRRTEYHGDATLVYWRFGFDMADQARAAGLSVSTLVPEDLARRARTGEGWGYVADEVDSNSVLAGAQERLAELTVVADDATSAQLGFYPSFFFVVFECRRIPAEARVESA